MIEAESKTTVETTETLDPERQQKAKEYAQIHRRLIVQSSIILVGFWLADLVMGWGIAAFGYTGLTDPATLPLLMIALTIVRLVTMPLSNAWYRWREVKADQYALSMTGMPHAFISAMTRLANQNMAEAKPPAWIEFLLYSHPSTQKRVAMAKEFSSKR